MKVAYKFNNRVFVDLNELQVYATAYTVHGHSRAGTKTVIDKLPFEIGVLTDDEWKCIKSETLTCKWLGGTHKAFCTFMGNEMAVNVNHERCQRFIQEMDAAALRVSTEPEPEPEAEPEASTSGSEPDPEPEADASTSGTEPDPNPEPEPEDPLKELREAATADVRKTELPVHTWLRTWELEICNDERTVHKWAVPLINDPEISKHICVKDGKFMLCSRNPDVFWKLTDLGRPDDDEKRSYYERIILDTLTKADTPYGLTSKPKFRCIRAPTTKRAWHVGNEFCFAAFCNRPRIIRVLYGAYGKDPSIDSAHKLARDFGHYECLDVFYDHKITMRCRHTYNELTEDIKNFTEAQKKYLMAYVNNLNPEVRHIKSVINGIIMPKLAEEYKGVELSSIKPFEYFAFLKKNGLTNRELDWCIRNLDKFM